MPDGTDSQACVHQLVQFLTAALVLLLAAGVALLHQETQLCDGSIRHRLAHIPEPQHPRRLTVHVPCPLPQLEVSHCGRGGDNCHLHIHSWPLAP